MKDFIFIHIPKNAGSAITKILRPHASPHSFGNHLHAVEAVEKIGRGIYQRAFTFSFVRNPWSRQVSLYNYIRKDRAHHLYADVIQWDFKTYVRNLLLRDSCASNIQYDFLYDDQGNRLVKFVGRFENLFMDFHRVCEVIGVDERIEVQPVTTYYQEWFDDESREIVEEVFEKDITTFGYDF